METKIKTALYTNSKMRIPAYLKPLGAAVGVTLALGAAAAAALLTANPGGLEAKISPPKPLCVNSPAEVRVLVKGGAEKASYDIELTIKAFDGSHLSKRFSKQGEGYVAYSFTAQDSGQFTATAHVTALVGNNMESRTASAAFEAGSCP